MTTLVEFNTSSFGLSCLFFVLVAASVFLEHHFLYERWRRYEMRRRATGIVTVMLWAIIPAMWGGLSGMVLWAVILFGFLVAGLVLWACHQYRIDNHKKVLLSDE